MRQLKNCFDFYICLLTNHFVSIIRPSARDRDPSYKRFSPKLRVAASGQPLVMDTPKYHRQDQIINLYKKIMTKVAAGVTVGSIFMFKNFLKTLTLSIENLQ